MPRPSPIVTAIMHGPSMPAADEATESPLLRGGRFGLSPSASASVAADSNVGEALETAAPSPAPRGSFGRAALARQSLETDAKGDDEVKSQGLDADVSHHLLVNELRLAEAAAAASAPSAAAPPHTASAVDAANAAAAAMEAAVPAPPPSSK